MQFYHFSFQAKVWCPKSFWAPLPMIYAATYLTGKFLLYSNLIVVYLTFWPNGRLPEQKLREEPPVRRLCSKQAMGKSCPSRRFDPALVDPKTAGSNSVWGQLFRIAYFKYLSFWWLLRRLSLWQPLGQKARKMSKFLFKHNHAIYLEMPLGWHETFLDIRSYYVWVNKQNLDCISSRTGREYSGITKGVTESITSGVMQILVLLKNWGFYTNFCVEDSIKFSLVSEMEQEPKVRGQGQGFKKKNPRPRSRTDFPRTDPLEAKDRNGEGQGPRAQFFLIMVGKFPIIIFQRVWV